MNDSSLISFKAISNFVKELGEMFSKHQKSLKLYCRLINKTTLSHDKSIMKHIDAFRKFCIANRESISSKSSDKIVVNRIDYSPRVFIDIKDIFNFCDKDNEEIIWKHILYISALVDPGGKALEILKKYKQDDDNSVNESNFLSDFIGKLDSQIDPSSNPMDTVSSVLNSGIVNDLIKGMDSGISNGKLDLGKLMGTVQNMVGKLGEKSENNPELENPMGMLNSLMSNMGNMGDIGNSDEKKGGVPDIAGMMQGMMQGLMSGNMGNMGNKNKEEKKLDVIKEEEE